MDLVYVAFCEILKPFYFLVAKKLINYVDASSGTGVNVKVSHLITFLLDTVALWCPCLRKI